MANHRRKTTVRRRAGGHLLILACSATKRKLPGQHPALELYDGGSYQVLRKFLNENGWPPGFVIKIISAKYGLLDAADLIKFYDQRLTPESAAAHRPAVIQSLKELGLFKSVFVNLGKDYLPAVDGIERIFGKGKIRYAKGAIGQKKRALGKWLRSLPCKTAKMPKHNEKRPYLYFFPDWDDFVTEPFLREGDDASGKRDRRYAHQIFGSDQTPYDGVLVSLAQLKVGKGALFRIDQRELTPETLRQQMRIPRRLLLFGDCGAFSYVADEKPPFTAAKAARLYDAFGFNIGASVDHIPLPEVFRPNADGEIERIVLTPDDQRQRMTLTKRNAEQFIETHRLNGYAFTPMGVIQGLDTKSYVENVADYIDMGYQHIALGGLVPRHDGEILEICTAVRKIIQRLTKRVTENLWIHLFGILRPKLQGYFRSLGVSSFDSASYLRKAWLRSDQNYIAPDGNRWYSTIRVPISESARMQEAATKKKISKKRLQELEQRCLTAIKGFDGSDASHEEVVHAINDYGPLLVRRGEDNHFIEKHEALLTDQPWKKCRCPFCKNIGIDVVVFRGAGRNKRRGLHNTWVFYHKILHGKANPSKTNSDEGSDECQSPKMN
jgi:hypothetical protein